MLFFQLDFVPTERGLISTGRIAIIYLKSPWRRALNCVSAEIYGGRINPHCTLYTRDDDKGILL